MAYNAIAENEPSKPKRALGIIAAASFLLGACAATIYQAKTTVAASLEVAPGYTYTREWTCEAPFVNTNTYGQSSGPLSAAGLKVTLGPPEKDKVELAETGEAHFETSPNAELAAELVPSAGVTVSDWAFAGLLGDAGDRALPGPGDKGTMVMCTGLSGIAAPLVNKETGDTPADAIYITNSYTYGDTHTITVTAFVDDKYYQSAFQVHIVTKGINGHDGATARSVGVAALAGIVAVLLMG